MYARPHPNVASRRAAARKQAEDALKRRNLDAMRRVGGAAA